ncbi:MAG: DUF5808 domain-containing protein [Saprospiraceae bacterium]
MDESEKPSPETRQKWHNDPDNWVGGIFYYNPADKRLLPPKRVPALGWTVNFGNPVSWIGFLGVMLLVYLAFRYL